ncbi:MAG: hypothetical protein AAFR44_02885 [Pseudomonadota bacterium]
MDGEGELRVISNKENEALGTANLGEVARHFFCVARPEMSVDKSAAGGQAAGEGVRLWRPLGIC